MSWSTYSVVNLCFPLIMLCGKCAIYGRGQFQDYHYTGVTLEEMFCSYYLS